MWIISNINNKELSRFELAFQGNDYSFYLKDDNKMKRINDAVFVDGYYRLRNDGKSRLQDSGVMAKRELGHLSEWIEQVSGNFIALNLGKTGFEIYSDRFAVKKFFYWNEKDQFIFSDNLSIVRRLSKAQPSQNNMAIYSLMYHFTGGKTIFDNIYHNEPGQYFRNSENNLISGFYWKPEMLLTLPKSYISIRDISEKLERVVRELLVLSGKESLSLSLTGGADTRNLLALFLKLGIRPHLYTYGNPASSDCVKALAISKNLSLDHHIHDIRIDEHLFEKTAKKIIHLEGGLASIHRVHRLIAVEAEKKYADFMYLGTLGGEFIKGASEDNYIVPSIVYNNWNKQAIQKNDLKHYLEIKNVNVSSSMLDGLISYFAQDECFVGNEVERKHNALSYITTHLHDAQDLNLYGNVMHEVFTPFLDIDYLELIFSSEFSFDVKEGIGNSFRKRIDNPVYASKFLKETYPELLKYKYAGDHRPSEVLFNKYLAAGIKILRQKTAPSYPQNFPLGDWMKKFVLKNLPSCYDHNILKETFNLPALEKELEVNTPISAEPYWLKFTNPIMMRYLLEDI